MVVGVVELVGVALETIGKVLDKFPNYDQKKKEKFHSLKDELLKEKLKEPALRDDNEIIIMELELKQYIQDFQSFLSK